MNVLQSNFVNANNALENLMRNTIPELINAVNKK